MRLQKIHATNTNYPQKVNELVAHVLQSSSKPWVNTDWLYDFFTDCIASLPMLVAVSEYYLEDWVLSDEQLADWGWLETPEEQATLGDADRLEFARSRMLSISDELIDDAPSIYIAEIIDDVGRSVVLAFSALPLGQAGLDISFSRCETHESENEILRRLGLIDVEELMALSDAWILARWKRRNA